MGEDEVFQGGEAGAGGFQEEQDFRAGFDFALPAIVRFDFGNEIGASDEAGAEGFASEAAGDSQIWRGDECEHKFSRDLHEDRITDRGWWLPFNFGSCF